MSYPDLQFSSKKLVDAGCVQGLDFVETMSLEGILGGVPEWLGESLEKLTVSDETRSKYPQEVIAQMEATLWRVYSLVEEEHGHA